MRNQFRTSPTKMRRMVNEKPIPLFSHKRPAVIASVPRQALACWRRKEEPCLSTGLDLMPFATLGIRGAHEREGEFAINSLPFPTNTWRKQSPRDTRW